VFEAEIMADHSDHYTITEEGWAYRTNSRGWTIYRDPQTGLWRTQGEAISIIGARGATGRHGLGLGRGPNPETQ
jgi:hypothetical protein